MNSSVGDKLLSIYVGVFSEGDYNHMKSIESEFQTKINYFDYLGMNRNIFKYNYLWL